MRTLFVLSFALWLTGCPEHNPCPPCIVDAHADPPSGWR